MRLVTVIVLGVVLATMTTAAAGPDLHKQVRGCHQRGAIVTTTDTGILLGPAHTTCTFRWLTETFFVWRDDGAGVGWQWATGSDGTRIAFEHPRFHISWRARTHHVYCRSVACPHQPEQSPSCAFSWRSVTYNLNANFKVFGRAHLGPITRPSC